MEGGSRGRVTGLRDVLIFVHFSSYGVPVIQISKCDMKPGIS